MAASVTKVRSVSVTRCDILKVRECDGVDRLSVREGCSKGV